MTVQVVTQNSTSIKEMTLDLGLMFMSLDYIPRHEGRLVVILDGWMVRLLRRWHVWLMF